MSKDVEHVDEPNTMELFTKWLDDVHEYATQVTEDLKGHPDPDEYFRQMDAVIAAKENTP